MDDWRSTLDADCRPSEQFSEMSASLQILDESYPPDADTGPELLSHQGEEGGVVIEGEIEITVGDQVRILGPGEGYLFDSRHACRVINGRVLEAAHLLALFADESQKLNVHLDVVPGNLLVVALGVNLSHAGATRKAVHSRAAKDTRNGRIR